MNEIDSAERTLVAFLEDRLIARGPARDVALALHTRARDGEVIVLDESNGYAIDLDVTGSSEDVAARYAETHSAIAETHSAGAETHSARAEPDAPPRRRGRPKLGVIGREVTLLPRHWAWLDGQRGGASATLRRLVEHARKENAGNDLARHAQDRTLRLMTALAGNRPGFEDACRALYAGDGARFLEHARRWPKAVREVVEASAADALDRTAGGRS